MLKKLFIVMLLGLVALPALGEGGLVTDEVLVQYPQGYTRVVIADLAKIVGEAELQEGLLNPLASANHPLAGIYRVLTLLQLDPAAVDYVAYGTGAGLTPFALVKGLPPEKALGALMGLQHAVGSSGSPYTNWELETLDGVPVVFTGGVFGPMKIQWAYVATEHVLWTGTEVAFGGEPDRQRLRASTERIIARIKGEVGCFSELPIAVAVRGGDLSFVRLSDPAADRPLEPGEQAMGYAVSFTDRGAQVHFAIRFSSVQETAQAQEKIAGGGSGYLAQDLYRSELVRVDRVNRDLYFDVAVELSGILGLLMLTIPM
jgi:hypothetical protein